MLGRTLPSGSDAISFHNTLFRVSELCWIKAVRLSPFELTVRVVSLVLAIAWVFVMENAKGTFANVEFLLALFPLVLAWTTSGSLRIGCSGDFEESYEERRGSRSGLFSGWIETLHAKEPDWVHLKGPSYDLLLNPHRVAWIRPCYQWKFYPLMMVAVFVGYLYLLGLNLDISGYPVIADFRILIFEGSKSTVKLLSYIAIATGVAAFALSIKRSVEVCGTGGVQDTFPVTASDESRLVDMLTGRTAEKTTPAKTKSAKAPRVMEVPVSAPTPTAKIEPTTESKPKTEPTTAPTPPPAVTEPDSQTSA